MNVQSIKWIFSKILKVICGIVLTAVYWFLFLFITQYPEASEISNSALMVTLLFAIVASVLTVTGILGRIFRILINSIKDKLSAIESNRSNSTRSQGVPSRTSNATSATSTTYAGTVFSSSSYLYGNELLERARHSAEIINTTTDIKRFVNAYTNMETAMTQLIELNESGKMKMTPTPRENLNGIRANIAATINDFIDRAVGTMPINEAARSEVLEPFLDELEANEKIGQMMTAENRSKIKQLRAGLVHETYIARQLRRIDSMEGHAFEHWCAALLRVNGFTEVSVTKGSGDQGVDVLAEKDGIRYAIQCKCYSSNLGNSPVQEVYAGKEIYDCHLGAVMTNREFTSGAVELAKKDRVLLWGREKLIEFLERAEQIDAVLV